MALTHIVAARNAATDAVVDRVDLGAANPQARIAFRSAVPADVVVCDMAAPPAFGAAAAGIAAAAAIAQGVAGAPGTVNSFQIRDRDNNAIISGTVSAVGGGGDVEISAVGFAASDTLDITSLTYQALIA